MKALVLHKSLELSIEDLPLYKDLGDNDIRIRIRNVGICGSDIHYVTHGAIGDYVVRAPMVLGHEASGEVIEIGEQVTSLQVGDRVCMEPGIPNQQSKETRLGLYNLDPDVKLWATPPVHGCLCETVVHPESLTYKLPDTVSLEEGAMVEPLAIGLQAVSKAHINLGDIGLVFGCGTIGIMVALAALAGGCSKVFISDINQEKLKILENYRNLIPVNPTREDLLSKVNEDSSNWGVDIAFDATGALSIYKDIHRYVCPGGKVVLVGIPPSGYGEFNICGLQAKEITLSTVFRYAHKFEKTINLISSGDINVRPLISKIYPFEKCIEAFHHAANPENTDVKIQISL